MSVICKSKFYCYSAVVLFTTFLMSAAPPAVNELFCYTIGPWVAPGFVVHDTPTNVSMTQWPFVVEMTWARDNQGYTFDDPYDFALRVRLVNWPIGGQPEQHTIQQVTVPTGYVSDVSQIDVMSGGQSIGFDPIIEVFNNGDRLSAKLFLTDVVNDEFLFVVHPYNCDGDLNLDTHRNIGDLVTCINGWGQFGIPDLIAVINNIGDECP